MDKNGSSYFITSKEEMLSELLKSRETGFVLGVFSKRMGTGLFLCNVKDVLMDEDEEDVIVLLNEQVTTGRSDVQVLYLNEIECIYTFSTEQIPADERKFFH